MALYTVLGRRWFERINGNTYHSVEVYKDGELIGHEPFTYGYGDQWEYTGLDFILKDDPTIPKNIALWKLRDYGHKVISSVTDVQRKKDL